jgi:hypothetical protein
MLCLWRKQGSFSQCNIGQNSLCMKCIVVEPYDLSLLTISLIALPSTHNTKLNHIYPVCFYNSN